MLSWLRTFSRTVAFGTQSAITIAMAGEPSSGIENSEKKCEFNRRETTMQDVMLPVRAVPKNDYITSPTAPSGTDRQFMQAGQGTAGAALPAAGCGRP